MDEVARKTRVAKRMAENDWGFGRECGGVSVVGPVEQASRSWALKHERGRGKSGRDTWLPPFGSLLIPGQRCAESDHAGLRDGGEEPTMTTGVQILGNVHHKSPKGMVRKAWHETTDSLPQRIRSEETLGFVCMRDILTLHVCVQHMSNSK
jgi:hypothetical protein